MDIGIANSHILHQGTTLRGKWSITLHIEEPLEEQARLSLVFQSEGKSWTPALQGCFLQPHQLPRSSRNQRLNRMFKQCRQDKSMKSAHAKVLAIWLVQEVWIHSSYGKFSVHLKPAYNLTLMIGNQFRAVWNGTPGKEHIVFDSGKKYAA